MHFNSRRERRAGMSATPTDLQSAALQSPGSRTGRLQPCTQPRMSPVGLDPTLKESPLLEKR